MVNREWRFPASNYGQERGLSTGDSETFKGRPYQAFAKEILQNSIDARRSKDKPVKVDFKSFSICVDEIPGTEELRAAIRLCKEYWEHKTDHVLEYNEMSKRLDERTIQCLRISDFNTKGLIGVESDEQAKNAFLALTKGSGVSEKETEGAGGSKGVGKNAAILMSEIKTIFYSTHTCEALDGSVYEYTGSIGVADFVSGYVVNDKHEKRDYTQGPGYYCVDKYNRPLSELFNVDKAFFGREHECGTDIYILGFDGDSTWQKEVLNSILDSFMVAIVRGELEISLNEIEINEKTIESVISNKDLVYKNNISNFVSQYRMLSGDAAVRIYPIETEYGEGCLYILKVESSEEELATHKCIMVRHPFMKIKSFDLGASFRVSALCIIGENVLGRELRKIENPEHNDWQPKRIKERGKRKEIENVINDIRRQINEAVIDCLQMGNMEPLDPNGAGDFLPDGELGTGMAGKETITSPSEKVTVISLKKNITTERRANLTDENGSGMESIIGALDDEVEGDVTYPSGTNTTDGGEHHPGENTSGRKDGDAELFRKSCLSGVRYKVISTDRKSGTVRVVFVAPIDYENCFLQVKLLDDANNSSKINIQEMVYDGRQIGSPDPDGYGPFSIRRNQKVLIDLKTDRKGYFASEVKVICK